MPSSIDRLSDDVICHILSFLRIKASASTSFLSRRWRFLWAHAPNLDFIGYEFGGETRASNIIHRIIALHRARTMNTLSVTDVNCSGYQLATWISHAVNRRARSLHLDFGGVRNLYIDFEEYDVNINALFTLPKCLLTCKTLVDVKLRCCRGIPSSGNVFLPCLKKLHLSHIVYEDEKSLPHLLSGCPVLQDLTIKCVYAMKLNGDDLSCVFVSSPTIKILNVDLEYGCRVLKINAPSLVYLNVRSYSLEDVTSLTTMTSLVEADITLYGLECWADDEIIEEYSNAVDFLNCLSNVKCLKILVDYNDMVVNIAGLDSMVKFDNLTELKLELMIDFQELVKFIGVAVNLEALTFSLDGMYFTSSYREPEQVSACMLSCLKIVRIKPSDEFNAHDFESIRYVLKNAQVLERMKLLYSNSNSRSDMEKLGVLRRIPLLEKGSESCELAFY